MIDDKSDPGAWADAITFLRPGVVSVTPPHFEDVGFDGYALAHSRPGFDDWQLERLTRLYSRDPDHDHGSECPDGLRPAAPVVIDPFHSPTTSDEGQHSDAR